MARHPRAGAGARSARLRGRQEGCTLSAAADCTRPRAGGRHGSVRKGIVQRTTAPECTTRDACSRQTVSYEWYDEPIVEGRLNVHVRAMTHDPDRLCPLLHRQAGPRRPEGGPRAARRGARADLHRPRADRHEPVPARPRPGARRRPRRRHARRAEARPAGPLGARRAHHRRRARQRAASSSRWVRASTTRPTRWARCSSTSWPPSPSSRPT